MERRRQATKEERMNSMAQGLGENDTGLDEVRRALELEPSLLERVTRNEHVWQGKIFSVDHLEVELADGSHAWREVVHHHGGAGVVAIQSGRVCLVRQYRVVLGRVTLEIPAGKLEGGEQGESCAARELVEETGLRAEKLVHLATVLGSPAPTRARSSAWFGFRWTRSCTQSLQDSSKTGRPSRGFLPHERFSAMSQRATCARMSEPHRQRSLNSAG